jgi:hypothetical protein
MAAPLRLARSLSDGVQTSCAGGSNSQSRIAHIFTEVKRLSLITWSDDGEPMGGVGG